jgi:uncharacterized Fe-S cluster-containing protein
MVKREYERMLHEEKRDVIISSCCHSINLLIQKYFPAALEYLADVVSPMQAHCLDIKKRHPNAKTVFIGPCVAKKDEAEHYAGIVDAVLTFEELTRWLKHENIELEKEMDENDCSRARFFPTSGGVLKTMTNRQPGFSYLALDGVENCVAALKEIVAGKVHKCFIEMNACVGSCVGGPVMEKNSRAVIQDYIAVSNFAGEKDFVVDQPDPLEMKKAFSSIAHKLAEPSEAEIYSVLRQMGKFRPEQELNCGSCGYNTCREKAIAIYQGKAEISMCLPFLKDKAESFSDAIVKNSPNALIVVNDQLEVQQVNTAALKLMHLREASDILGTHVDRILDPAMFNSVQRTGRGLYNQRAYLAEYSRYVDQTVVPAEGGRILLCIIRDVTSEEDERRRKEDISRQTAEVADKVVDKQMRIVQEIASLLGETAAETKIALSKLKESISNE